MRRPAPVSKFETPEAGEKVYPMHRYYYMSCCDCGLVHKMEFGTIREPSFPQKVSVWFRVWRDNRRTAAMRRSRHIKVTRK